MPPWILVSMCFNSATPPEIGALERAAAARIAGDVEAGKPLIAHVVVALADNASQGIVPVPAKLGDGDDPKNNLYWGARYGLRTFLTKDAHWSKVQFASDHPEHVLERIVLTKEVAPGVQAFIVADAWQGSHLADAIRAFTRMGSGHDGEVVFARIADRTIELRAGGDAHLVAYLGHNGLMEITVPDPPPSPESAGARATIVLACISRSYFEPVMKKSGAFMLLGTRGLMAPEAYTLDAALGAWFRGKNAVDVKHDAAVAYCRYQKCSTFSGEQLFATE